MTLVGERPILRHTPIVETRGYPYDTESVTDIYTFQRTPTPVTHRRRPHTSNTLPVTRSSTAPMGHHSHTLPPPICRASYQQEDPPSYKSIEDPNLRRTRSGNIKSMSLPRPPDEDEKRRSLYKS